MAKANPQYKLSLTKTLSKAYSDAGVRAQLRPLLANPAFRQDFGQAIIERIIDRTSKESVDKHGDPLHPYSKSYMKSDDFKIYGKTSKVTLELTGEMLSSMQSVVFNDTLTISLIGRDNKDKAAGAVYGIKTKTGKVIRDFLGLPEEEVVLLFMEAIEQFQNDSFASTREFFSGLDAIQEFGQVGSQSEFMLALGMEELIRGLR